MCFKFLRQILWKKQEGFFLVLLFFFFVLTKRFPGCLKGSYFKDRGCAKNLEVLEREEVIPTFWKL